jgi:hypothetical protein
MYYIGAALIYLALTIVFVADVLRNRSLTSGGRIGWIAALLIVPIFAWPIYGIIRMREKRGLA